MNKVVDYYSMFDEWGRLEREPLEFLVNLHYIHQYLPPEGHLLDNGAGPGKYAMELAKSGFRVTLTDLTPRLVELARQKAVEIGLSESFGGFHVRDARELEGLDDGRFDASLMLGPLYHLQAASGRIAAVKELNRVTKKGGIVFVAFRSRTQKLLMSLKAPQHWKPLDNMDAMQAFLKDGIFNHTDEGRFTGAYFHPIQDIGPFMESCGFQTLTLVGSTGLGGMLSQEQWDYWKRRGEEEFNKLMQMICDSAANPYLLGISSHLLYIGRKT